MPRTRPPSPPEFRAQIIALHRARRTPEALAKEFEPSEATIRTGSRRPRSMSAPAR